MSAEFPAVLIDDFADVAVEAHPETGTRIGTVVAALFAISAVLAVSVVTVIVSLA
jgi:hypothetical protein